MALTRARAYQILDSDIKQSVRAATTTSVTLSGGAPSTLDTTVNLSAGDRILVKDQSPGSGNGVYVVQTVGTGSNGTWVRASDFDETAKVTSGLQLYVEEGTLNGDKVYGLTTNNPITLGTTALTFSVLSSAGTSSAGGADTNIQYNSSGTFAGSANLTFDGSNVDVAGYLDAANLRIGASGNTIQSNNTNGNIYLTPNGTGAILANANITAPVFISNVGTGTAPFTVTSTTQVANLNVATAGTAGTVTTAAQPNITSVGNLTIANIDNIQINDNTISSTNTNGNINLTPNGTGEVIAASLTVSDLTSGRLALVGASGALTDTSAFTWSGSTLSVAGAANIASGSLTADSQALSITQTWNNASVTFTSIKSNITDTASNAASLLLDLQVGGTSKFKVDKTGSLTTSNLITGGASLFFAGTARGTNTNSTYQITSDTILSRAAAASWQLGAADAATPVAQTLTVQSVVAGTADTAGANLIIAGSKSTGTGLGGAIIFQTTPAAGSTASTQNSLANVLVLHSNTLAAFTGSITSGSITSSGNMFAGASQQLGWNGRTGLTSPGAQILQIGAIDGPTATAQTLQVQSVSAATTDGAGADFTIKASGGTGTGAGGKFIFQVAPASGVSGTTKNSFSNVLVIDSTKLAAFQANVTVANNITYGGQLTSNVATGTAPFVVTSTTQIANLNVATAGSATTAGTVTTAAQPNITSVGTLSALTVGGVINQTATTAPSTPAADSMAMYVTTTGTSPNKTVTYYIKNEAGESVIVSSVIV